MRILTERRTPFLFFLICTNASQISTRIMSLPTMANYLISLPDTYREDEIQNGAQIVLCSQPNTGRGPHCSETPTLLERQQRKIYIYKFRGSIPRIPPSPQQKARLHPKQSGLRTVQRCLFERHLSAFGDTSSFASTATAAQGNVWHPYCSSRASRVPLPPSWASVISWRCWMREQISPTGYE